MTTEELTELKRIRVALQDIVRAIDRCSKVRPTTWEEESFRRALESTSEGEELL